MKTFAAVAAIYVTFALILGGALLAAPSCGQAGEPHTARCASAIDHHHHR